MMFLSCSTCGSYIKDIKAPVKTLYGTTSMCTDNWHSIAHVGLARWNAEDDAFMWRLDLAFRTPLDIIMKEYEYLR